MRLIASVNFDVRYQIRHGFYAAYAIVTLMYIFILSIVPEQMKETLYTLIVFSDPSFLGAFFVGGIVLLEKGDHILDNLFVTPYKVTEYLLSKAISLAILTVLTTIVIKWAVFGFQFELPFFLGVALTSMFFTLLGIVIGSKVKTLNQYLLLSSMYVTPFALPVVTYFGATDAEWMKFIPTYSSLYLIDGDHTLSGLVLAVLHLTVSILLLLPCTYKCFYHYVVLKKGN